MHHINFNEKMGFNEVNEHSSRGTLHHYLLFCFHKELFKWCSNETLGCLGYEWPYTCVKGLCSQLCLSVFLSLSPQAQEIHSGESNTNRERERAREGGREREKLADQGLVVTRASRLSISPPFLLTGCWRPAKALRASRRATLAHKEFHNSNSC